MKRPGALPPELKFLRILWKLDSELQSASRALHAAQGVTARERLVIRIIGLEPGVGVTTLARVLVIHPSTLVPVLARLERRGLVSRKADTRDGRRRMLRLTARGRRIDELKTGTVEDIVGRVVARRTHLELVAARRVLSGIVSELDQAARRR